MQLLKSIVFVGVVLGLFAGAAAARVPTGWPFLEYNEAVRVAKQKNKPLFVYYGFETCQYCVYLNNNTLSYTALRTRYTEHYVLAYFDIRGKPGDIMTLPNGEKLPRGLARPCAPARASKIASSSID